MSEIMECVTIKILAADSNYVLELFLGLNESNLSFYKTILHSTCHFDEVIFVTREFKPVFSIILLGGQILVPGGFVSFVMDVLNVNGVDFSHRWVNNKIDDVELESGECVLIALGGMESIANMIMPVEKTANVIIVGRKEPMDNLDIESLARMTIRPAPEEKKGASPIKTIPKSCVTSDFLNRRALSINCSHRRHFYLRQKK
jgi:hypothetical protein